MPINVSGKGTGYAARQRWDTRLDNLPDIKDLSFRGKPLPTSLLSKAYAVDIEMSIDQVTNIVITFDDPGFAILSKDFIDLNTPVNYRGLSLYVAAIQTGDGGGLGGTTVHCRPLAVKRLKNLQGKRVLHNLTPAAYLRSECKKARVRAEPVAQESKVRKKIARDTDSSGDYDKTNPASAWTTLHRLAAQTGFVLFEIGGAIHFGKPTWLIQRNPTVDVVWYANTGKEPATIPQIRRSVDSNEVEIQLTLPLERAGTVLPGHGLRLRGFPRTPDTYIVKSVSYPLAGDGEVSVVAGTPIDPEKQAVSISTNPTGTDSPMDPTTQTGAKRYAATLCAKYGWGTDQFNALVQLWTRESGWNYRAENPSSGAYGIPQSLPGSKMATEGADWRTNPETQIRWGLKYIKGRYGDPLGAWAHFQAHNWY